MGFGRSANYALWSPSALTVHRTVIHYLLCSNPKDSYIQGIPLRYYLSHGGDDGIRTHDPLLAGQVLSQLSYTPILNSKFEIRNYWVLLFLRFNLHEVKISLFGLSKNFIRLRISLLTKSKISLQALACLVGPSGLEPPIKLISRFTREKPLSLLWVCFVSA